MVELEGKVVGLGREVEELEVSNHILAADLEGAKKKLKDEVTAIKEVKENIVKAEIINMERFKAVEEKENEIAQKRTEMEKMNQTFVEEIEVCKKDALKEAELLATLTFEVQLQQKVVSKQDQELDWRGRIRTLRINCRN